VMVSLRGVQTGGAQQGSALPEQRCHLHSEAIVVRVVRLENCARRRPSASRRRVPDVLPPLPLGSSSGHRDASPRLSPGDAETRSVRVTILPRNVEYETAKEPSARPRAFPRYSPPGSIHPRLRDPSWTIIGDPEPSGRVIATIANSHEPARPARSACQPITSDWESERKRYASSASRARVVTRGDTRRSLATSLAGEHAHRSLATLHPNRPADTFLLLSSNSGKSVSLVRILLPSGEAACISADALSRLTDGNWKRAVGTPTCLLGLP
jgi:hypothetical protein